MKKCLFGGALLAAGMSASANAQFSFSYSYVLVGAYAYGVSGPSYDQFVGAGFWSVAASEPGALATSDGTATLFEVRARADQGSGAFSYDFFSYFTVGSDTVATANWDLNNAGFFIIDDLTNGVNLLTQFSVSAGSAPIALEAGTQYRLAGGVFQFSGTGEAFAQLVIPAPASAGLLALAGLAATRRRR